MSLILPHKRGEPAHNKNRSSLSSRDFSRDCDH
jgi:hypothetical protein